MQQQNHLMLKSKRSGHSSEAVSYTHLTEKYTRAVDKLKEEAINSLPELKF